MSGTVGRPAVRQEKALGCYLLLRDSVPRGPLLHQRSLAVEFSGLLAAADITIAGNGLDVFIPCVFDDVDDTFGDKDKGSGNQIVRVFFSRHTAADVVLAPALDEILSQIGLDMVVGPGPVAGRDAYEAHHQRFAAAGMDIDPKLMGQLFFVVNVFLDLIPIHDDGTMFFRHVYPPQDSDGR